MAQNGQNYYRQYEQSPPPVPPRVPGANRAATQSQFVRRTSSFDAGDDDSSLQSTQGSSPSGMEHLQSSRGNGHRRVSSLTNRQDDELFLGDQTPPTAPHHPTLSANQVQAMSGYQHQYLPRTGSQSQAQATYNPQEFARAQAPAPPPVYGNAFARTPSVQQPYNPAAYRTQTTPGLVGQGYGYASNGYGLSPQAAQGSAVAPLPQPPTQGYGGRQQSQYGGPTPATHNMVQYSSNQVISPSTMGPPLPPLPPLPALPSQNSSAALSQRQPAYSPPAPPPPPFPPTAAATAPYPTSSTAPYPTNSQSVRNHRPTQSDNYLPSPPRPEDYAESNARSTHRKSFSASPQGQSAQGQSASHSSPPAPTPPEHTPRRSDTSGRHPHSRPLPGPPVESDQDDQQADVAGLGLSRTSEEVAQEDIWRELEAEVMRGGSSVASRRQGQYGDPSRPLRPSDGDEPDALFAHSEGHDPSSQNGEPYGRHFNRPDAAANLNDDSDPEAAAGLAALRVADERDAADNARSQLGGGGPTFGSYGHLQPSEGWRADADLSSDSDYANIDMGLYGGGYGAPMSYGNDFSGETMGSSRPLPDVRDHARSSGGAMADGYDYAIPDQDAIHPFPNFNQAARVDTFGTGGLAEPSPHGRRTSFDEGDETIWDRRSGSQSPSKDDIPEMFYFPRTGQSGPERPLPPVPPGSDNQVPHLMPAGTYLRHDGDQAANQRPSYPVAPDAYSNKHLNLTTAVPRSSSLTSHSSTPQTTTPARSKTDAEERRARFLKQQQLGIYTGSEAGFEMGTPESVVGLDLPAIPAGKRKKFNPAKLSTADFRKCSQPWALSSIAGWVKEMSEDETDLKEKILINGIVALFTHKVPTMNIADAETLGARVVQEMFAAGTLVHEEEWVKFGPEGISGVLWQLTGSGCYAPMLHSTEIAGRCYSHHCSRTLKKINLQTQILEPQRKLEDWATFYKVKKEDVEGVGRKEIERQNNLHEIVQTEDQYTDQLNVLRVLYRDQLTLGQPPIIQPDRVSRFTNDVFGKVDAVKKVNEDFLLAQLKYRQQEQGPWIVGFSDIFREWIRKAKAPYTEYAASFPKATMLVRKEAERNMLFRQFLDQARDNERSKRLGWDTYLKAPITRLQRYGLLLYTVHKNMIQDTEEKTNLQIAMDEIKAVTLECDARVAEMSKKIDLLELGAKLILRPGMERVELNLNHLGRELIFKGDLQRTGANRFTWLETHAILFDHYLVLAKTVHQRDSAGGMKHERYDVSKLPIPMDLLVLESTNDDPVVKSSVKGIGAVTTVTTRAQTPAEARLGRTTSAQNSIGPGNLTQTNSSSSVSTVSSSSSGKTMVASTVLEGPPRDEKIMYPFRVKHLGQDVYTLYAPSAQNRQDWCDKILEAKTKHAASLFAQNAEPFRLRIVADTAFAYDSLSAGPRSIIIKGTPLDRALREVERTFETAGPRPGPVCRAAVNCATAFNQPYGKTLVAIGTDYGVYISDMQNPRGWSRAISIPKVTQVAVLEEFSLFLLIAEKSLIAYHLDVVCPVGGAPPGNDSARKAPQKLSGAREVGFFATGRMKDRTLVFYKKREGLSSTFKVLEPVFQKATEKKSRFSRKGTTEFFREYDEFYIPTECFGINLFHSSLAVSTTRGFEVMTLDKKQGWAVPDLKASHVASIAARLANQKPLGMFRLNETEFLLCYEECAVYVDKHGDVNRVLIMEFVGKAKAAAMYAPYILLFDQDFVEIRNAENGRLKQVIAGRDVRCLDDARSGGTAGNRTVKIALQHPEAERTQIVVELLLNEGRRD